MNRHFKTLAIILAILAGCSCPNKTSNKKNQADYEISANEEFQVSLKSNPTTGYSWRWVDSGAIEVVDSVAHRYVADKKPDHIMISGRGGREIWTFKGVKRGVDTLKMEYCRPWEKGSVTDKKVIVVRVK